MSHAEKLDKESIMNIKTMSHAEKISLFTLGTMNDLVDKGFVDSKETPARLSKKGRKNYKQLLASGFEPTEPELMQAFYAWMDSME
jgi:hypothetical protein